MVRVSRASSTRVSLVDKLLFFPRGLSLDSDGNIIVADSGNQQIKIFSPEGKLVKKAGLALLVTQSEYLIVSDYGEHCIKVFDREW